MTGKRYWLGAALALAAAPALAVNTDGYDIPYIGVFGTYTVVDNDREWSDDFGYQVTFGLPLSWESYALELSVFGGRFERDVDGQRDYHNGLTVDLVRDFGGISFLSRTSLKPYALAGIGAVRDDVQGQIKGRAMANVGGGALFGLPWWGLGVRTEFRLVGQHQSPSAPGENLLLDYRFLLGLQLPLTPIFGPARPGPLPDVEECEVAVVDPITGRTDCQVDSDGDGVPDHLDQCPGTPPGVKVDDTGCPVADEARDSDGDGVPDDLDQCPDTFPGVTVNMRGCAEPQPLVIPRLTFDFDTARLTADAREVLDDFAAMLHGQDNLTVEIIGHTDSLGRADYNQRLSERRAAAVKSYLVDRGIGDDRLSASGRGESQPVASNETEEGRSANRRVAFWLYVD